MDTISGMSAKWLAGIDRSGCVNLIKNVSKTEFSSFWPNGQVVVGDRQVALNPFANTHSFSCPLNSLALGGTHWLLLCVCALASHSHAQTHTERINIVREQKMLRYALGSPGSAHIGK